MRKIKKFVFSEDEHIFIAGRTGTGKTFLVHALASEIADMASIFVHDTKGTSTFDNYTIFEKLSDLKKARETKEPGIFVYRPRFEELELDYYDEFYKWIYNRKDCVVIIDEAMQVCESPKRYPQYLKGILTRGREYNIAAWVCTQRPKTLPLFLLSEASKFFVFELNLKEDRQRLVEITGREEFMDRELCEYCFHYFDVKKNEYFVGKVVLD